MFVYSVKASSIKFFSVIFLSVALLAALIILVPAYESAGAIETVSYEKVKTNEDRVNFLSQFGWQVKEKPLESQKVKIPDEFDTVFIEYNNLQKLQGLDLSQYQRKDVMRYTYEVSNYPDYDGKVYANVLVYKNRVVGGDICSADYDGFVLTFEGK